MVWRGGVGESRSPARFSIGAVLGGAFLGFLITFAGAVLVGLAVSLTPWEGISADLHWFSYVSIAIGGMLAGKRSQRVGWLHGGAVGLIYFVVASILFQGDFAWGDLLSTAWLARAFWSFAAGALGGALGINL